MWTCYYMHPQESREAENTQEVTDSLNLTTKNSWPAPSGGIAPFSPSRLSDRLQSLAVSALQQIIHNPPFSLRLHQGPQIKCYTYLHDVSLEETCSLQTEVKSWTHSLGSRNEEFRTWGQAPSFLSHTELSGQTPTTSWARHPLDQTPFPHSLEGREHSQGRSHLSHEGNKAGGDSSPNEVFFFPISIHCA